MPGKNPEKLFGSRRSLKRGSTTVKNMVIMIQWSDHDVSDIPMTDYEELFNSPTHGINNPTGSVKEFFYNQSYGALTIDNILSGWLISEYSKNQASGGVINGEPCNSFCGALYALQTAMICHYSIRSTCWSRFLQRRIRYQ